MLHSGGKLLSILQKMCILAEKKGDKKSWDADTTR